MADSFTICFLRSKCFWNLVHKKKSGSIKGDKKGQVGFCTFVAELNVTHASAEDALFIRTQYCLILFMCIKV